MPYPHSQGASPRVLARISASTEGHNHTHTIDSLVLPLAPKNRHKVERQRGEASEDKGHDFNVLSLALALLCLMESVDGA